VNVVGFLVQKVKEQVEIMIIKPARPKAGMANLRRFGKHGRDSRH
jgi:hypothetical protein